VSAGSKIWNKARALARHVEAGGSEGSLARTQLERLVDRHPELGALLEEGSMASTEVYLDAPSPMHVQLLRALCAPVGVSLRRHDLHAAPAPACVWSVQGEHHAVARVCDDYHLHGDSLTLLFEQVLGVYVRGCLVEEKQALEAQLDASESVEMNPADVDLGELSAWEGQELARSSRIRALAQRVPLEHMHRTIETLINQSADSRGTVAVTVNSQVMAWNDPQMSFDFFFKLVRKHGPPRQKSRAKLEWLYDRGYRWHPGIGEMVEVPTLRS